MLIRSQDKNTIVNLDNVNQILIKPEKNTITVIFFSGTYEDLGNYSTTDKAKKVLDLIEKEYGKYLTVVGGPALMRGGTDIQPAVYNIPKTLQIPKDDEVEV